jgi:hypothetical protein
MPAPTALKTRNRAYSRWAAVRPASRSRLRQVQCRLPKNVMVVATKAEINLAVNGLSYRGPVPPAYLSRLNTMTSARYPNPPMMPNFSTRWVAWSNHVRNERIAVIATGAYLGIPVLPPRSRPWPEPDH